MSSSTAEEALLKAQQIAAKLRGEDPASATATALASSSPSGTKRKRWGTAPATLPPAAVAALPGMDLLVQQQQQQTAGGTSTTTGEVVQKRVWLHPLVTRERPAAHFVEYLKPLLPDLADKVLRDHGKETSTNTTSAEPSTKKSKQDPEPPLLSMTLKGKGSSGQPAQLGIPEEPLHVYIEGPGPMAEQAFDMVETVVEEAKQAPVTVDITASDDQMQHMAQHNDLQLASYKPATVAQLIGQQPDDFLAGGGGGSMFEEDLQVPNGVVGFIIGRGGETISSMQARTGAKVQIQKEHELQPGQTMRKITVTAPTQEGLEQCKTMIESMVSDRVRAAGGSSHHHHHNSNSSNTAGLPPQEAKIQEALNAGHHLEQLDVPDADVGLIIGKGGQTIHGIQEQTGASVQIPTAAQPDKPHVRTMSITHPNIQGAQAAAAMIQQVLDTKRTHTMNTGGGGAGGHYGGPQVTIQVMIPDKDVGLCIGRQGCVIKEMQNKTGTRIQIPGQPTPGQPCRVATVSGPPDKCEQVRQMIERIQVDQSSACVMNGTGGGGGGYHSQQQQHGYPGQYGGQAGGAGGGAEGGNYSAEWAAYYAAQAVAQQQQQQPVAVAPAPAPVAAAPAPASDAYHEQFFRYAYYYGEPAARQYYGAWSPPQGTPNPYGVNPDGITAPPAGGAAGGAPAAAAAPAPTPAPAPVAAADVPQNVRDSSVRKVSNLPAWMTRAQGN